MSKTNTDRRTDAPTNTTGLAAVREHREALQEHAETDRPTAYLAETLLDLADTEETGE